MTYAANPSLLSRLGALFCSALVHAAIGIALFVNFPTGTPEAGLRAGDRGHMLVVELLPLPDGGSPTQGEEQQDRPRSENKGTVTDAGDHSGPLNRGNATKSGLPPPGEGGSGEAEGATGLTDSEAGAPAVTGAAFRARLLHHIERFRRYPPDARKAGQEGVVRIHFVMDRSGDVLEAWIVLSSGSALLDEEAVAAVMRARPLPTPPDSWPGSFSVTLPIGYSLQ